MSPARSRLSIRSCTSVSIRLAPVSPSRSSSPRKVVGRGQAPTDRVVDVVVDVGDAIDKPYDLALQCLWLSLTRVGEDAVAYLRGQVQLLRDPERLLVVAEAGAEALAQAAVGLVLPAWPKGGCPMSWPSPIASVRSSFKPQRAGDARAMPVVSSVWVIRVR